MDNKDRKSRRREEGIVETSNGIELFERKEKEKEHWINKRGNGYMRVEEKIGE